MLCKRILPLMTLLVSVAIPLFAQESPLSAPEEEKSPAYQVYEVKKGDTLWGVSKKFIEDPYYWPDLWANNPDIQNPHFIFPGQKLRIYAGPITVVGLAPEEQEPVTAPVAGTDVIVPEVAPAPVAPVVAQPKPVMIAIPSGVSFIGEGAKLSGGSIFDFPDARHFAGSGDTVFIRLPAEKRVAVGDLLQIIKPRADIIHPVSKKRLGFQVDQVGTLEITVLGKDLHTAIIRESFREVERGAWLAPHRAVQQEIALRRATAEMSGMVISTPSHKNLQGPSDALFVDLGSNDGLKIGNLLTVTRSRQATDLAEIKSKKDKNLNYPEELVGFALVVETDPATATAVILKSLGPALVGDQVRAQTGQMAH